MNRLWHLIRQQLINEVENKICSINGEEDFVRDPNSALEIRCYGDYAGQGAQHRIHLIIHALPSFFRPLCFA